MKNKEKNQAKTILGLHGYKQNGSLMLKKLEKMFTKENEFDCPEGKVMVNDGKKLERGWWPLKTSGNIFDDMELSLENLPKVDDHYDIAVSFSQGCSALLMLLYAQRVKVDMIVMMSPFKLQDPAAHKFLIENPLDIPVCIVYGKNDTLTSPEVSKSVEKYFKSECVFVQHPGGHFIPEKSDSRQSIRDFITKAQQKLEQGGKKEVQDQKKKVIPTPIDWRNWDLYREVWNQRTCYLIVFSVFAFAFARNGGWKLKFGR